MRIAAKNYPRLALPVFGLIVLLFFASCSDANDANSNNANQSGNSNENGSVHVKDNAVELSTLIKLPVLPNEKDDERADWREEKIDQKGKKLTAILKYNEANTAQIVALAEKHKAGAPVEIGVEEWYPEELMAQTQLSGNESLKGVVYEARDFYNPPYEHGRLIKINESNFFVLELTTY